MRPLFLLLGFSACLTTVNFSAAIPASNSKHKTSQIETAKTPTPKAVVIGKLGQVSRPVGIHYRMSKTSPIYYSAPKAQYLVLSKTKNKHWMGVLLQNGATGYVPSDSVDVLAFVVTRKVGTGLPTMEALQNPEPTSRSGMEGRTVSNGGDAEVAQNALNFIGTPYVWGGNSLRKGIDCSGFVKKLFGQIGVELPRTAHEQAMVGTPIMRLEDLRPGDRLYFWETKRHEIGHTGIYIGNGYFVHASHGHHGVATDYLTPSWQKILVAARRS